LKYLKLSREERHATLRALEEMPEFLTASCGALPAARAAERGPEGLLSPVEQCWHLADLEREGFGTRIRRLLEETHPHLPDFDGARLVRERAYATRSVGEAIAAFRSARLANLQILRSLDRDSWARGGTQEGVGEVALCDMPHMMSEHDGGHRAEIALWRSLAL
jgi:hypothetical protein